MREAPKVEQLARQNAGKVRVVSIGLNTDLAGARQWAADHDLKTTIGVFDEDQEVARHYGLRIYPGWMLIDGSGNLMTTGSSFDDSVQDIVDGLN